jgi:hypothetical protein
MKHSQARLLAFVVAAWALIGPATTRADHDIRHPFTGTRPFQLDFHGGFTWWGWGFAGGARFGIPIVHNGFVPSLNNAAYVNFGADFYFVEDWVCYRRNPGAPCEAHAYRFSLGFPVTLHWEFYFNDTWSAFAELGFQVYIPPSVFHRGFWAYGGHAAAWVIAAAGGSLHLGQVVALTLRVGLPYVALGVTLNLG